ncbi:MAG: PAS domain-containing protein [Nanoarchaeota archaeon]
MKESVTPEALLNMLEDLENAKRLIEKERALSESIINSLPGVFYVFDDKGKFKRWNKNFEIVTGYSSEECSKMTAIDLFEGEDKQHIAERIKQVFIKGNADAEAELVTKKGIKIPYYFTGHMIKIDNVPNLIGLGIDITERKKAEKEIKESEKKFRNLYENSVDFLLSFDKKGSVIDVNKTMLDTFGYTKEEVIGKRFKDFVPLKYFPRIIKHLTLSLMGKATPPLLVEIKNKKGSYLPIEFTAGSLLLYEKEKLIGLMVSGRDISERLKKEEELKQSHESYKSIFDGANYAIFIQGKSSGEVIDANKMAAQMFGYTEEEIKRSNMQMLSEGKPPYSAKEGLNYILKASKEGTQVFEWKGKKKDGTIFWIEINLKVIKIEGKDAVLTIIRDISDRKKAQDGLLLSSQRFKDIVEKNALMVYALNPKGEITYVSPLMEKAFGFSSDDVKNNHFKKFIPIKDLLRAKQLFDDVLKGKKVKFDIPLKKKQGGFTNVHIESTPIFLEGKVVEVQGTIKEIR